MVLSAANGFSVANLSVLMSSLVYKDLVCYKHIKHLPMSTYKDDTKTKEWLLQILQSGGSEARTKITEYALD